MANRLDPGFMKADSSNMPEIDVFMGNYEVRYLHWNQYYCRSCHENYGDEAVGYVCLRRDQSVCIVKCRVTPEHNVRSSSYAVMIKIDEEKKCIARRVLRYRLCSLCRFNQIFEQYFNATYISINL